MVSAINIKEQEACIVDEDFIFNDGRKINKGDVFICTESYRDYDGRYCAEFEIYPEGGWKFWFKGFHDKLSKI